MFKFLYNRKIRYFLNIVLYPYMSMYYNEFLLLKTIKMQEHLINPMNSLETKWV